MSTPSSNLDELLDTMPDPPLETRWQDEAGLPIFDGENSPQNISVYGFLLGAIFGGSALFVAFNRDVPQIGLFLAALALFHVLEYIATALFNPHKLTLDSYLINHSDSYHAAHAITLLEFALEFFFFPQWKAFGIINFIGLILIITGQYVRTAAMFRAKSNFSHHIAERKEQDHQLITTGIYSIMRHPSYFGFYWWALGAEIMLFNPICFFGFLYVLHDFFSDRIRYEEYKLTQFFGAEYTEYRKRTRTWIPFIN